MNQIDTLQILINGGIATTLVIKDITGEIISNLQIIWDKNITQKDMRFAIRIILSKLGFNNKIEMAVISIIKKKLGEIETKNYAVDIVEPDEQILKDRIQKWKMIQQWNNALENNWLKYGKLDPKCATVTEKYTPYNIITEFSKNPSIEKIIEVMIWEPKDINLHINDLVFERFPNDLTINKGK